MRESILVRIDADPPARLWNGVGGLQIPADDVEPEEGALYLGGAELVSVPDFQQLIGGTAERLEYGLSGVSAATFRIAAEDAQSVEGARIDVGRIRFDDNWQQGVVTWEAAFRVDTLSVSSQTGEEARTRSISLSIGTDETQRSRAPIAFFTDADQRRRSSDDAIFDHVASISAGTSRRFGPS